MNEIAYLLVGYSPPGAEKITQHLYDRADIAKARARPDAKENFECGREDHPVLPNIWLPEGTLLGFKEACLEFFWVMSFLHMTSEHLLTVAFHIDISRS